VLAAGTGWDAGVASGDPLRMGGGGGGANCKNAAGRAGDKSISAENSERKASVPIAAA